ncbi:YcxB family protein [uncultured Sphingomonas sp.]|uniref:YcxB family protein n=1 Tax=uncultured Sphingomonas sp. TaxID=158754 RepID=UPI0025E8CB51|nr:YcxB family protein [uncultured Sphingomonas sp.]
MHSVTFEPTQDDVIAASRLNYRATLRSGRVVRAYLLPSAVLALLGWFLAGPWSLGPAPLIAALAGGYWLLVFSLILWTNYLFIPSRARRNFAQQRALHDRTTITWSPAGISFVSERGHTNFAWTDFIGIVRGRDVIILRQTDLLVNFVPTRLLDSEQLDSFPARV